MYKGVDDKSEPSGSMFGIAAVFILPEKLHMFIDHQSIVGFLLKGSQVPPEFPCRFTRF